MLHILSDQNSIACQYLAEIRDVHVQKDRLRFRKNLERIGSIIAYEISKKLTYLNKTVETPLGLSNDKVLAQQPTVASILRAGQPLHNGVLEMFDNASNAFVSAYRKHHKDGSFEIKVEYVSCPNISDRPLIICDPMLATGASMVATLDELLKNGQPSEIHILTALCAQNGIDHVRRFYPTAIIWTVSVDEELTGKSYIVPGLGDAGDLAFGPKVQE